MAATPFTPATAMPVSTFLTKAEALKKKGPMALFSGDLGVLKKEMQVSGGQIKAERLAAEKAGRKPDFCPPAKASMNSDELLNHLRAIPAGQRGVPFKAAYKSFLVRKFPCPA
ncbi:MAG TPA: hypothetical protein VEZ48_03705 [Sphingomonadaceae bacterium]|nr:hypothetical protein [Sphingomonadaceae bacterium]